MSNQSSHELKDLLVKMKNGGNFLDKAKLFKLLKTAPIIQPLKQDNVNNITIKNMKNEEYLMFFTSREEMETWKGKECETKETLFPEALQQLIGSNNEIKGIVINPFTDNCILDKEKFLNAFQYKLKKEGGEHLRLLF